MDWAELNPELLCHIAQKVSDISDFVRLRAVCKRWRSAVHLSDMAPQFPCFINLKWESGSAFVYIRFRHCFLERVHVAPTNNLSLKGEITCMYGSSSEFVLLKIKKSSKPWLLINPLTGFHVTLPLGKHAYPIYFGHSCCAKTNRVKSDIDVVMSEEKEPFHPTQDFEVVCLWRYDGRKWTRITRVTYSISHEDVTYCNGRLCVISQETGHVRVIDINTGKVSVICGPTMRLLYLIEAGGHLLCVFRNFYLEMQSTYDKEYQFEVYQLENFGTDPYLRKWNSIGNWVIIIDSIHSALCLKASDCKGYRSNCIYLRTFARSGSNVKCAIVRYDIETNTTEVTQSSDPLDSQWFVPSLF